MKGGTLKELENCLKELKRLRTDVGKVRDRLETLLEDAKEEEAVVGDATDEIQAVIDRLSEHH